MPTSYERLKLGKGAAFVKSRLRRLPQFDDTWEADIGPIQDEQQGVEFWLGMVIEQEHGALPAIKPFDHAPTVNDLASLLAHAMYRPLTDDRQHRPATILLRRLPEWDELLPHLEELRIDVVVTDTLPVWTEAAQEFGTLWAKRMRKLVAKTASEDQTGEKQRSKKK
jgi:Domain of unknown function (DUF6930)